MDAKVSQGRATRDLEGGGGGGGGSLLRNRALFHVLASAMLQNFASGTALATYEFYL